MKIHNKYLNILIKLLYTILEIILVLITLICIISACNAIIASADFKNKIKDLTIYNTRQELRISHLEDEMQATALQRDYTNGNVIGLEASVKAFNFIEDTMKKRIALEFSSGHDFTVLDIIQIGEDTSESMKRLYLCADYYKATLYIADYITGNITSLNARSIGGQFRHWKKNEEGNYEWVQVDYQLIVQDLDGDNIEDILFISPFEEWVYRKDACIDIWLQRDGEFMPISHSHCGIYNDVGKWNEFSQKISDFEEGLRTNEAADTDYVINWVKTKLFAQDRELLEELLRNPADELHYTQLRQPSDLNVTATLDVNDEYHVSIPQNPYSEKGINTWLKNFYEEEEQRTYSFMGYGERDSETMTPEERAEMGFYRSTSLSLKRADDAIISFFGGTYEYSGGAHGNSYYFGVNFDPRSGKYLTLKDIFINDYLYTGELHRYIMEYIDENFNEYGWGQEHIRDALTGGGWCLTGYGFKIFLAGGNGGGEYEYDIPYELLVGYLKTDYFPTDRSAEYLVYFSSSADNGAKMDINADGILDIITGEEKDDTLELSINGKISNLTFKNGEETFSPHNGYFYLIRDKDGITSLEARLDYYREVSEKEYIKYNVIFVYNIIDEQPVWVETHIYPEEQY